MIKYLPCTTKARCLGISREICVSFVESQGYTYSNATHSDDSYGYIENITIDSEGVETKSYALVIDDTAPYYNNIPDVLKARLISREEMVTNGWFQEIPIEG